MAIGLNSTNLANAMLNGIRGTSFSIAATWIQLHTGDPSSTGTANPSAVTIRNSASFAAATASAGSSSIALAAAPASWTMTASETISSISVWTASSAGLPLWTANLTVQKTVASGDTLTLNTCGLSLAPLAV